MLKQKDNNIWKRNWTDCKEWWNGTLNTHPDYMSFDGGKSGFRNIQQNIILSFLIYKEQYKDQYCMFTMEIARSIKQILEFKE